MLDDAVIVTAEVAEYTIDPLKSDFASVTVTLVKVTVESAIAVLDR